MSPVSPADHRKPLSVTRVLVYVGAARSEQKRIVYIVRDDRIRFVVGARASVIVTAVVVVVVNIARGVLILWPDARKK